MNIIAINSGFAATLQKMGHRVFEAYISTSGSVDVQDIVRQAQFTPDLLIQKEHLGAKVLLKNLHTLHCKKVFCSIDTHLNYFWQWHYGVLFDIFFTPHQHYMSMTAPGLLHPRMLRLPECGFSNPFQPHSARSHFINVVARLSSERHLRNNVAAFLQEHYHVRMTDNVSHEQMRALYAQSRVVVNESIATETNFRILEGASCGCCVISPPIGKDQDLILTPGKEILIYEDALHLWDILDYCQKNTAYTESIGRAAWEKIQAQHMLEHRVQSLMEAVYEEPPSQSLKGPCTPQESQDRLGCALALLCINDQLKSYTLPTLLTSVTDPTLRHTLLLAHSIKFHTREETTAVATAAFDHLQQGPSPYKKQDAASLATLCGGFFLYLGDLESSALCLELHNTFVPSQAHKGIKLPSPPLTVDSMFTQWIETLESEGQHILYGAHYSGYAQTALDMVLMYMELYPIQSLWAEKILASPATQHTHPVCCYGATARMSLNAPSLENSLVYLSACLRSFHLEDAQEALSELLAQLPSKPARLAVRAALRRRHPQVDRLASWHMFDGE